MKTFIGSAFLVFLMRFNIANCIPFDNGDIIYNPLNNNYSPYTMPSSCKDQTYCLVKGDDYPDDEDIEELMKKYYSYLKKSDQKVEQYAHRLADSPLESECGDRFIKAPVYYIKDTSNMTRAVVQSTSLGDDLYYTQEYNLRWCENKGPQNGTRNIPQENLDLFNLKMTCENTSLTFDFHVISTGPVLEMEIARAEIPVCCKCRYVKPSD